ncbi:MAG: aminotransferase class III-fold pyridoxal phosphate-dependent enzyme, partial [Acidobacteria bacterium]|nr:aminotransferase class III-fold pyridoxal phosphate-dependent enzyme [Acidobacteriota bacterium]
AIQSALTTIELLETELLANAQSVGAHMLDSIRDWPRRFRCVGDTRGLGLMIGIELVKDQATKERAPELRNEVVLRMFEKGVLILGAGANSIRLCPPLVLTREQADFALAALAETLAELGG